MTSTESVNLSDSTSASTRPQLALPLIILFLVCALMGWGVGISQANKEVNSRWRIPGYTDWIMNSDFQTKSSNSESCSNVAPYGCGVYHVVSKYDCSQVTGSLSFEDDNGKNYEFVDASAQNVTWGKPFTLEFDATVKGKNATKINLIQLKCKK